MEKTGEICEIRGEVTFEWRIKDFFPLSDKKDKCYESPIFYFSGSTWNIGIYPNGSTEDRSENFISIYLRRWLIWPPITVKFSLTIQTDDSQKYKTMTFENVFEENATSWGNRKLISRTELEEKKVQLNASDDLIVNVTLKSTEPHDVSGTLFSRFQKMSDDFKELFKKAKKTDIQFKVDGQSIGAHRFVLEARSPVFSAMLNHDTRESQTGEVSIVDLDKDTLETVLVYMYSGVIENLTNDNVQQIYAAAEKYDLKAVKEIASRVIIENLSVESVCDVIKFSELFQDKKIGRLARKYFKENADKILETETWEAFMKENQNISVELLSTVVKTLFKK